MYPKDFSFDVILCSEKFYTSGLEMYTTILQNEADCCTKAENDFHLEIHRPDKLAPAFKLTKSCVSLNTRERTKIHHVFQRSGASLCSDPPHVHMDMYLFVLILFMLFVK